MIDNNFTRIFDNGMVYKENQSIHSFQLLSAEGTKLSETEIDQLNGKWLKALQIEITDCCNERCVHCYIPNDSKKKGQTMSKEKIKDLLRQFREMNGLRVIFSGAETLLHPDLMELLRYARQLDFMLFLHTNLIILNESQAQELSELNMFNVQVSLYSDKAEVHDSITGKQGSYMRTVRGLEMLARHHVPVTISCPIMKQNIATIEGVKAYADQWGFGCYFDEIMMAQHNGDSRNLSVRISKEEMPSLIERLIRLRPEHMQSIRESESEDELLSKKFARRMTACHILSSRMCIDSDGTAYPCAGWNGMKLGNVNSSPLEELWQNGNNVELLRKTKTAEFAKCRICNFHNFCDMCPVYNYNENGDITEPCAMFCEKAYLMRNVISKLYKECKTNKNS